MSALTDKIKALAERMFVNDHENVALVRNILADVRELETELVATETLLGDEKRARENDSYAASKAIRQAKREAYEHALRLMRHGVMDCRVESILMRAIDALDTDEAKRDDT